MNRLSTDSIIQAHERIKPYIHHTPLIESTLLNELLGSKIIFKAEPLQKTGSFKIRGALNAMLAAKERGILPGSAVAFSSGNHAQAVAYAAKIIGVRATIFSPVFASPVKLQAAREYGANVIFTATRQEAEEGVKSYIRNGDYFIPPYDHDDVIAGQGTACLEALQDGIIPDAIFAPCGGGGLISGTWLSSLALCPKPSVYGAEPANANDAAQSLQSDKIIRFADSPATIADGVATLGVSERTFHYLKQLSGIIEVEERDIIYWTQWLIHLLKITVEPTSALAMAAAAKWIQGNKSGKTLLVILSAGNISQATYHKIWEYNYLDCPPDRESGL